MKTGVDQYAVQMSNALGKWSECKLTADMNSEDVARVFWAWYIGFVAGSTHTNALRAFFGTPGDSGWALHGPEFGNSKWRRLW